MCTEGWGGIEQMELVWAKKLERENHEFAHTIWERGSTANTQWVVMGVCTGAEDTVSTCGFCPLLWCIVARSVTTQLKAAFPRFSGIAA